MYSSARVSVDKGLGFDFSAITDLVKSALPVGLNIFQQQQQLKTTKQMVAAAQAGGYALNVPGLPAMYNTAPSYAVMPTGGVSTTTMLAIGGAIVAGVLAYKFMR